MKKLYPEFFIVPQTDEMNDTFIKLAAFCEAIKETQPDNYKSHVVLLHDIIREHFEFPNKLFTFAIGKEDGKMCMIFFDKEPDGNSYQPKYDEELGVPYIELEEK
jgi:hypothetical protein